MADFFTIAGLDGRKTLEGTIRVGGAKNAVLPALAASLLFADDVRLENVPAIEDVARMRELLSGLGVLSQEDGARALRLSPAGAGGFALDEEAAKRMRASIVLTGPLLARFGRAEFPHPGGDVIGPRPIDLFLDGFRKMGASVTELGGRYAVAAEGGLKGTDIFFPVISVTGTETLMLAAVLARGETTLRNAAMEPEIEHLAAFLNACGARIEGAGTPTMTVRGAPSPKGLLKARGKAYRTLPDRIEAGSFLILGALAAKDLVIADCMPEHLAALIELLAASGVPVSAEKNALRIRGNGALPNRKFKALSVRTHEYPGFATDLQPPMTVFLTQVTGEGSVFETIWGGRLNYTEDLVKMGADITLWNPQQATVKGPTPLSGKELESPDIRAGLAFVIAATVAKGKSVINNVYHIDRGYGYIERRLRDIGVSIERVSTL